LNRSKGKAADFYPLRGGEIGAEWGMLRPASRTFFPKPSVFAALVLATSRLSDCATRDSDHFSYSPSDTRLRNSLPSARRSIDDLADSDGTMVQSSLDNRH
jgi:hypothetical protein